MLLISRLHSCVVFLLRLYLTLLPQAQEPVPQAPALQGNPSEPRLAPPRHGTFTPGRISVGRPPCVIPVSPGAGTGRKYHCPWRNYCETARHRLFCGRMDPLAPYWPSLTAEPGSKQIRKRSCAFFLYCSIPSAGGHGASSSVACPCSAEAPSGRYSDDWIFYCRGTLERLYIFTSHFLLGTFGGFDNRHFHF